MTWGKKEEKRLLPDLPPYRGSILQKEQKTEEKMPIEEELGEEYSGEKHELPSFPDSMNDKGFSQAAIKDAVSSNAYKGSEMVYPGNVNKFQTIEVEEWNPSMKDQSNTAAENKTEFASRLEEPPRALSFEDRENRFENFNRGGKNADIFVKLDKFYSARKSLFDAQQKLDEIDALLRKVREVKLREEQELSSWEKEINDIKTKINDVTINLFEKVD